MSSSDFDGISLERFTEHAQSVQDRIHAAQTDLAELEGTGSAADGLVSVTVGMDGVVREVRLHPDVVDPKAIDVLEQWVGEAFTNANQSLQQRAAERLRPVANDFEGFGNLFTS